MASGGAEAAGDMVVVVAAGEESLVLRLLVDDALDAAEVVDAAGDGDGALLREPVLLLRRLEQRHEQRVLQVPHRNNEPLLLLPAAGRPHHPYRHAPLGRHPAAAARASSSAHRRRRRRVLLFLQKVHAHLLPRTARLQQGLASSEDVCYNDAAGKDRGRGGSSCMTRIEEETVVAVGGVYGPRGGAATVYNTPSPLLNC
jgi:hypothetical protein